MSDESDSRSQGFVFVLAGVVVLLLLAGGAFFVFQARQSAMLRAEREVAVAEMEAVRARAEAEEHARRAAEEERQTRKGEEKQAFQAQTAERIETLVAQAEEALRSGDPSRVAVAQAGLEQCRGDGGTDASRLRLERCWAELRMFHDLDDIDSLRWIVIEGRSQDRTPELAAAFKRYEIAPGTIPTDEAAQRITQSPIRDRLLAALDRWLIADRSAAVRDILRAADPDPFRTAVRDAIQAGDAQRLKELAAKPEAAEQPPWFVAVLGECPLIPTDRRTHLLKAALGRAPSNLSLLMTLGQLVVAQGDQGAEAVRWYQAGVGLQPQNAAAWINLGAALLQKGDVDGATAAFREAIRLDPKNTPAHLNLGVALLQKGDSAGAIACFREAIRLDPANARARTALGRALHAKGDAIAARETFREAIRLDPADPKAHTHLGEALLQMGDIEGAIAAFRQAIRLDPKDAAPPAGLGKALKAKGDPDGAIAAFREAARLDPKRYESLLKPSAEVAPPPRPARP